MTADKYAQGLLIGLPDASDPQERKRIKDPAISFHLGKGSALERRITGAFPNILGQPGIGAGNAFVMRYFINKKERNLVNQFRTQTAESEKSLMQALRRFDQLPVDRWFDVAQAVLANHDVSLRVRYIRSINIPEIGAFPGYLILVVRNNKTIGRAILYIQEGKKVLNLVDIDLFDLPGRDTSIFPILYRWLVSRP